MKITRRIIFAFIISTLAGILLFLYLFYSVNGYIGFSTSVFIHCLFCLVAANTVGLGFTYLSQYLNKKAPWHGATTARFTMELVAMALGSFVLCYAFLRLYLSLAGHNAFALLISNTTTP